ncbi:hypothetical protein AB0F81_42005 [Actinoplanes sp. NPDC024001]|uniref:hypothetical protein n=1 Tax=Actinoplanes sp. NPDC024001 TaxID=3154598 RepID=UPI0033C6CFB3
MRPAIARFVVLMVALVAGLAVVASPAQAAVPVKQITPTAGLLPGSGCSHGVPPYGAIFNDSTLARLNIGAIHLWDCNYGLGNYDIVVPPSEWTSYRGWRETAGVFIGSGYCARVFYQVGASWPAYPGSPVCGPVQLFFPAGGISKVMQYRR